jgi:hypothetical protein
MSDDYNVSYSFQVDSPQPQTPPEELVAFTGCDRVELANGAVLLMHRDSGRRAAVAPEVALALTHCESFRTPTEHARHLVDTLPQLQGQVEEARKVLAMVGDAGLMLKAREVVSRLTRTDTPANLAPTRVFIITCDRPDAVTRLLESMLHARNLGQHDELILVDDSRDAGNRAQNREAVTEFNCSSPKNMAYLGSQARQRLLKELVTAHPGDEPSLRFLLDQERWQSHKSYGLARNLCLLLSVGYRCIVLDDDVLCRTVLPPEQGQAVTFGGGDGRELACFESEQALMAAVNYSDLDPLAGHARCLGMSLGQSLAELGTAGLDPASLQGVNAALLDTLHADSPILVSQCGSWGDPGVPGSHWFTGLDEASQGRLLSGEGGLAGAWRNRYYWLGRRGPNISKMAVMSQATGLDNSRLLPPYFPAGRGEDYLFAGMLVYLHPNSAVLDYDWSVPHLPLAPRTGEPSAPGIPCGGLGLCGRYLADRTDYRQGVPASARMDTLIAHLRELGEGDSTGLLATFRAELAQEQASRWQQLDRCLKGPLAREDEQWNVYLREEVAAITNAVQVPASLLNIPEIPAGLDENALLRQFQGGIIDFANALEAWPRLRESAAAISSSLLEQGALAP